MEHFGRKEDKINTIANNRACAREIYFERSWWCSYQTEWSLCLRDDLELALVTSGRIEANHNGDAFLALLGTMRVHSGASESLVGRKFVEKSSLVHVVDVPGRVLFWKWKSESNHCENVICKSWKRTRKELNEFSNALSVIKAFNLARLASASWMTTDPLSPCNSLLVCSSEAHNTIRVSNEEVTSGIYEQI